MVLRPRYSDAPSATRNSSVRSENSEFEDFAFAFAAPSSAMVRPTAAARRALFEEEEEGAMVMEKSAARGSGAPPMVMDFGGGQTARAPPVDRRARRALRMVDTKLQVGTEDIV